MFKIDPEFKKLIPPLSADEFKELEEKLLKEGFDSQRYGCITTWNNIIIDGHNRYEICTKNNIKFETLEKEFESREDVKDWIDKNQLGRRNISLDQRKIMIGRLYLREKNRHGGDRKSSGNNYQLIPTAAKIANENNISEKTVRNYADDTKYFERLEVEKPEIAEKIWNKEMSISEAKKEEKKEILEAKKQEYTERIKDATENNSDFKIDIFETDKKFRVIYTDPPWSYGDKQNIPNLGGAEKHYDNMSIDQLCDLPIDEMTEKNAVLFIWVTSPLLEECFDVIKAWGFKYKSSFVWDKISHNMGHYNSVRHEFLLICTKGSCLPDEKKLIDSVQSIEKTNKHSQKPIEFMNIIDELYTHGNRIELFCREAQKENWFYWGNEV